VHARAVRGFTLVEVLVAVFVLAVAVVGAAAAQISAARTRQAAATLSNAVLLAGALAEGMLANPVQMGLPDSANPYLQLDYDAALDGAPDEAGSCFGGASCSSEDIAAADLAALTQALHAGFPGARAMVCRDAAAAAGTVGWACSGGPLDPVVIKLGWRDKAGGGAPQVALVVPGALS
jgi:type IV pilus assembly protein PilV